MTKFESYVPALLNFRDNSLVYSSDDLAALRQYVLHSDNGIVVSSQGGEFGHELCHDLLPANAKRILDKDVAPYVERVGVYYYHHRVILNYTFRDLPASLERRARSLILAHSKDILVTKFVARINSASADGGPLPDESGRVTAYYSYCILFVPFDSKVFADIENLVGSHTFRIVEVTPRMLERDRIHIVRISLPSLNIYSTKDVKHFFRADIVNAIYQHMLYAKKEQDERDASSRDLTEFSASESDKRNVMEESQLHALWDHAVSALGGRMVDLQGVHQQTLLFRASILALLLSLVGIIMTVALALR